MNKKIILAFVFLAFFIARAWAHPPSDIKLSYDPETEMLHVSMRHTSKNPRNHRIREIVLYINDQESEHYYYSSQTSGSGLETDIYLQLKSQDRVRIKAICSEAGYGEAEITIP